MDTRPFPRIPSLRVRFHRPGGSPSEINAALTDTQQQTEQSAAVEHFFKSQIRENPAGCTILARSGDSYKMQLEVLMPTGIRDCAETRDMIAAFERRASLRPRKKTREIHGLDT